MGEEREAVLEPERERSATAALAALPGLVAGALEDVRTIARGMQVLPELARALGDIENHVIRLDEEVRRMRAAVEDMGGDVKDLPSRLDHLSDSLHPLQRIGRRLGGGRGSEAEPLDADDAR